MLEDTSNDDLVVIMLIKSVTSMAVINNFFSYPRFTIHRITNQEAKYKLCRVKQVKTGPKNVPFLYTSDGRTIRYPDPLIKVRMNYNFQYPQLYHLGIFLKLD